MITNQQQQDRSSFLSNSVFTNLGYNVLWGVSGMLGKGVSTGTINLKAGGVVGFPIIGDVIGYGATQGLKYGGMLFGAREGGSWFKTMDKFRKGFKFYPQFKDEVSGTIQAGFKGLFKGADISDLGKIKKVLGDLDNLTIKGLDKGGLIEKHFKNFLTSKSDNIGKVIAEAGGITDDVAREVTKSFNIYARKQASGEHFWNKKLTTVLKGLSNDSALFSAVSGLGYVVNTSMNLYFGSELLYGGMKSIVQGGWNLFEKTINPTDYSLGGREISGQFAVTQRQRAIQAIQQSHLNARSAIGNEAAYLHR